jgi:hypothetical protein
LKFKLSDDEAAMSNKCYNAYVTAERKAASEASLGGGSSAKGKKQGPPSKSLTQALQHASHPSLVELMGVIRPQHDDQEDNEDNDQLYDAEAIAQWTAWRECLLMTRAAAAAAAAAIRLNVSQCQSVVIL